MVLTVVYNMQLRVYCTLPIVRPPLRRERHLLDPVGRTNLNHWTIQWLRLALSRGPHRCLPPFTWGWKLIQDPKRCVFWYLEFRRMKEVQKPSNSEYIFIIFNLFWTVDISNRFIYPVLLFAQYVKCKIWGFHGGDYEQLRLLGCYAVWLL
jgi:hypothetical protein